MPDVNKRPRFHTRAFTHETVAQVMTALTDASGGPDACHPWTGHRLPKGYGTSSIAGKTYYATHLAYWLYTGMLPTRGLFICHHCDNPGCVNPRHLFLATAKGNTADMIRKGRHSPPPTFYGEAHPNVRVSDANRARFLQEYTGKRGELNYWARELGCTKANLCRILKQARRVQ